MNPPAPPGTPDSWGDVSSNEGQDWAPIPPDGCVSLALLSGESIQVDVDHVCSVGWLRNRARNWLIERGVSTGTLFDVVYNERVLRSDYVKIYDVAICYDAVAPTFTILLHAPPRAGWRLLLSDASPLGHLA